MVEIVIKIHSATYNKLHSSNSNSSNSAVSDSESIVGWQLEKGSKRGVGVLYDYEPNR